MSDVCRQFGNSRKTGYKIWDRYRQEGLEALCDRSRRPVRYANQLPDQIERLIVETKRGKPHWGARKIRELLVRRLAGEVRIPAKSTVHAVLDRHGLVKRARQRRRFKAEGTVLSQAAAPNDLWCADFKGEFKTGDGRTCYPLTVSDQASRMILCCEALESTREAPVIEAFLRLFQERGLPAAIRSDNGLPFASPNGLYNLSKLSVWWLRLGIAIERIRPGHPQQNGRHERMHRTLKAETARPPGMNVLQQQDRFDRFVSEFNEERTSGQRWCPVRCLTEWQDHAAIDAGPIFRGINRHGHVADQRLSGEAVCVIVKRAEAAGFDPAGYSGHSLRAGLATSAAMAGASAWKIRQQTGHASDAMLNRYIRDGDMFTSNAAGAVL